MSRTHELNMLSAERMTSARSGKYCCEVCNFYTSHKGHYRDHVHTDKHCNLFMKKSNPENESNEPNNVGVKPVTLSEVMEMFMKHQESTAGLFMKHQETTQIQNTEMFKALAERIVATQSTTIASQNIMLENNSQNQINTNTNIQNKKFNLNLFLNEECKNAMNLSDFIQSVVISMEDLEHIGEVGYTEGMSKILSKAIRNKDATARPLHCTDVKRETIYVKTDDAWKKDQDYEETKRLIQHIAHKNYKALAEWREQHPEHLVSDTADYEAWYSISRNMCNVDPAALNKLVRHIAVVTAVEKSDT